MAARSAQPHNFALFAAALALAPFQVQDCNPCIRVLNSFPFFNFGMDFGVGLLLHRWHPNLAAWLGEDTDALQGNGHLYWGIIPTHGLAVICGRSVFQHELLYTAKPSNKKFSKIRNQYSKSKFYFLKQENTVHWKQMDPVKLIDGKKIWEKEVHH